GGVGVQPDHEHHRLRHVALSPYPERKTTMNVQHPHALRRWLTTMAVAATCVIGLVAVAPGPAQAAAARTSVWVGSPLNANWAVWDGYCPGASYPSDLCSWPTVHHTYRWNMPYVGDWGADLGVGADKGVTLYAAPNDSSRTITARVEQVVLACSPRSGESYQQK